MVHEASEVIRLLLYNFEYRYCVGKSYGSIPSHWYDIVHFGLEVLIVMFFGLSLQSYFYNRCGTLGAYPTIFLSNKFLSSISSNQNFIVFHCVRAYVLREAQHVKDHHTILFSIHPHG